MRHLIESMESLTEGKLSVKKVQAMTDDERKKIPVKDRIDFHDMQWKPYAKKLGDKVAKLVNSEARNVKIVTWNHMTGAPEEKQYVAQGLLEKLIKDLEERV